MEPIAYEKIKESLDAIFAYALKRTNNRHEAEDLSQEIILNLYMSVKILNDLNKFYGWMWAVAENVYKSYLRKKQKNNHVMFQEEFHTNYDELIEDQMVKNEQIGLLYREISLLSGLYRETMMLYYLKQKSCAEIAHRLNLSETTVKQYLFKSRKKVKEGLSMIRERGERSFNPKKFNIYYWGNSSNIYNHLFKRKLPGNIMIEAYYEPITIEQLSIELGVASVYLEDEIKILEEHNLIKRIKGQKIQTNLIIFTEEFEEELHGKSNSDYELLVNYLNEFLVEHDNQIRSKMLNGSEINLNQLKWQVLSIVLYEAVIELFLNETIQKYPVINDELSGYVWGLERVFGDQNFDFGINGYQDQEGNEIRVFDYYLVKKNYHEICKSLTGDLLLKIANSRTFILNEYEETELIHLIQHGYVKNVDGDLSVNLPVFNECDYKELKSLLKEPIQKVNEVCHQLVPLTKEVLSNYIPKGLEGQLDAVASLKQVESFIIELMSKAYLNHYIELPKPCHDILTAYIICRD